MDCRIFGFMKKIKAIILGSDLFVPENQNGIAKTTYNILKDNLALDATFVYPSQSSTIPVLNKSFSRVKIRPVVVRSTKKISLSTKLSSIFRTKPFICDSRENIEKLADFIKTQTFDKLIIMGLGQAEVVSLLPRELLKKTIVIAIDSLSFFYKSRIENEKNFFKKALYKLDNLKAKIFEKKVYQSSAKNIFVSPYDADWARKISSSKNCIDILYGVDFNNFEYKPFEINRINLLFTGNFNYSPNVQGALFLAKKVMPILRHKGIEATLVLAGANPVDEIKKCQSEDVVVTGHVASMTEYLQSAAIFLSPIFFGAGVKTKVLEAMYMGCIVLGTPESFWAINAKAGRDFVLVEDTKNPKAWADQIERILNSQNDYREIGHNAHQIIEKNHSWEMVREMYNREFMKEYKFE